MQRGRTQDDLELDDWNQRDAFRYNAHVSSGCFSPRSIFCDADPILMFNIVRNREDSKWNFLPEAHTCDGLGNIVLHSSPSKGHLVHSIRTAIQEGGFMFNAK
jgi:hypothetical protein